MIIETKYNIGDEVWFQDNGQPLNREIVIIEPHVYKDIQLIKYYLYFDDGWLADFYEQDLFPTKEELLKSL